MSLETVIAFVALCVALLALLYAKVAYDAGLDHMRWHVDALEREVVELDKRINAWRAQSPETAVSPTTKDAR